jgi:two-component system cit operon sensor histidine kinase CitA
MTLAARKALRMTSFLPISRPTSFQTRTFLLLLCVSFILSLVVGQYVYSWMSDSQHRQIAIRAQVQAQQISRIADLVEAVQQRDIAALNRLITPLKQVSDANFIVIGDRNGRRLLHTDPHVAVGSPMVGGDNYAVLRDGKLITSLRKGSLGLSWRAKAPIRDSAGNIIGVVSVGYLQAHIENGTLDQFMPFVVMLACVLLILFVCSWVFANGIKRQMLNLEPMEIARLVRQQDAMFDSIYEGILSIDVKRQVTAINSAAREMLKLQQAPKNLIGRSLDQLLPDSPFLQVGPEDKDVTDEICLFGDLQVIASRVGIHIDQKLHGWVISFRRKDDINSLSLQLSQVKRYADNLRVIRHEHLNWISTLSGLLHIKAYDEALKLVQSQSEIHQQVLDYISRTFGNYLLCGLLIGKYYRAKEMGMELEFDPGCHLEALPDSLTDVEWMSIIGNLLHNAFDATLDSGLPERKVVLYISDEGSELIIEVADRGRGVDPALRDRIFERGVSRHGGADRGIGLYLINNYIKQAGGTIIVEDNIPCGAIFTVFAPKRKQLHA